MNDNNSLQTNENYKNLNQLANCSKCNSALTQKNYKKERSVCKICYNNHVLGYYKNTFCSNSSPKSDASTQTDELDRINKQDISSTHGSSNKQFRSSKQNSSRKQAITRKQDSSSKPDGSDKQDISSNYITDADPNLPCDKLREISEKHVRLESDCIMAKMIID